VPGIFGLITHRPPAAARAETDAMRRVLVHEPFYRSGLWQDAGLGVYAGWVARAGSFADGMPLRNETGDVTLLVGGEEYPEPGLRAEFRRRGHAVSESGPDYLVHRCEEEPDFPRRLNGRVHGLAVDRRTQTALLFNDRFGLQPIYFHQAKDGFYFACEAKAILAVRPELRAFDPRSLGEYISCGCALEGRTLFPGINALPPGSAWRFRAGQLIEQGHYFQTQEWEDQEPLPEEEYYRRLREAFAAALPKYFQGPEKIGVSLTGGWDTRVIMAHACAANAGQPRLASPGTLPCYTYGSAYRDNQDVKLARRVAELCGQSHQVIPVDDTFLSRFSHYAERTLYLAEGGVDICRAPDLYVSEQARHIAPVRMVGNYGSEIINRAVMFKPQEPEPGLFAPETMAQVTAAAETYRRARERNTAGFVAFRQCPWYHYGLLGLEQTQVAVRSPYLDNAVVAAAFRAPATGFDPRPRLAREADPRLGRLRNDRGIGGQGLFAAIQRAYLEFTFKAEYAYDYGMPQWVAAADHLLAPLHLERIWLGRHKIFHFRIWYRTVLANYVQEILLDPRSLARPYVHRVAVEQIVRRHLKGDRNYTTPIHRLLSLELLHRTFVDADSPAIRAGAGLAAVETAPPPAPARA
jgi:asparagine synthase (glutamine-hydrolysing)